MAWRTGSKLWGRWLAGTVATAGTAGALGFGAVSVFSAHTVNSPRARSFTDAFVLTPETLRMPYRKVSFETSDGIVLSGWWIKQTVGGEPSKHAVLCCAPFNQNKSTQLGVARGLWESGRSVLLFDFRSFAPNPTAQSIGYLEMRDARGALAWLRDRTPRDAEIALVGASMGGAVALTLAEEECARARSGDDGGARISACATDCAFSSLHDVVHFMLSSHYSRGALPSWITRIIMQGVGPGAVEGGEGLSRLDIPLLVVHSEKDSVVPVEHAFRIFNGVSTPKQSKELVIEPGLEHIGSFFHNEQRYVRRIVDFLDRVEGRKLPVSGEGKSEVLSDL